MKVRPVSSLLAVLALLLFAFGHSQAPAAENTTDPIGYVSVSIPAQSDAVLAVPLFRTPAFRGAIASIAGNVITLASAPNWMDDQFVQAVPAQNEAFAILVATGDAATGKEGLIARITANDANSLTIELAEGDTLAGVKTEQSHPGEADQIDIMPYWTPASLLGSRLSDGTQMLLFPTNQAGINIHSQTMLTKSATAWFNDTLDADHLPLFFGQGFVLRNSTNAAQTLAIVGAVPMSTHRQVLKKNAAAGTAQDIRIGYTSPVPEVIGTVHLGFSAGDQLLVFDNTAVGKNKSSTATLIYSGSAWFNGAANVTNTFQLQPGQGYIFRRAPSAPAGNTTWATMQSYLQ
jgi:uncharacterized protein (TIGR02597 family)